MAPVKWVVATLTLAALVLSACASTTQSAATPTTGTTSSSASAATSGSCEVKVDITASSGTTWGAISANYDGKSVTMSKSNQTLSVPCGTSIALTQKPTNPSEWQFKSWAAKGTSLSTPTSGTIHVKVTGPTTIDALYTAASGSNTSSASTSSSPSSKSGSSSKSWG